MAYFPSLVSFGVVSQLRVVHVICDDIYYLLLCCYCQLWLELHLCCVFIYCTSLSTTVFFFFSCFGDMFVSHPANKDILNLDLNLKNEIKR